MHNKLTGQLCQATRAMALFAITITIVIGSPDSSNQCHADTKAKPVKKAKPAKKRKPNPAMTLPEVDPALPNVLLVGDSISIGYTLATRDALKGVANVYRPLENCGPTTRGLEKMTAWLGDTKWDVIHFNFGLHDLKYLNKTSQQLSDPSASDSVQQVSLQDYEANIEAIARQLKETGAQVIWRETTSVPDGAKGRTAGDSKRYNEAASRAIVKVGDIDVDPFYGFAASQEKIQLPANVHYTAQGSRILGEHVADVIKAALSSK